MHDVQTGSACLSIQLERNRTGDIIFIMSNGAVRGVIRSALAMSVVLALSACGNSKTDFSGYIDTDMSYLSSSYPGRLQALNVQRGTLITATQKLFEVDPAYETLSTNIDQFNLDALKAEYEQTQNQIDYAKKRLGRERVMAKSDASSKDDVELALKNLDVLKNQLANISSKIEASRGVVERSLWQKSQKTGVAPSDGLIFDTYMQEGEYVQAGQPIVALITPKSLKVTFFVGEAELAQVKLASKVQVTMDGVQQPLTATVDYISSKAEYTPPVIFSREERTKLVFKVIARPESADLQSIHLGQPVTVSTRND